MYRLKTMLKLLRNTIVALIVVMLLTACKDANKNNKSTIETLFDLSIEGVPFKAQVAVFDSEKMRGLMFRATLTWVGMSIAR